MRGTPPVPLSYATPGRQAARTGIVSPEHRLIGWGLTAGCVLLPATILIAAGHGAIWGVQLVPFILFGDNPVARFVLLLLCGGVAVLSNLAREPRLYRASGVAGVVALFLPWLYLVSMTGLETATLVTSIPFLAACTAKVVHVLRVTRDRGRMPCDPHMAPPANRR